MTSTFPEFNLQNNLLQAISEMGFNLPSPIQNVVIPKLLNNSTDVIALAQTGTGKTAAFGLPILEHLKDDTRNIQALILAPTRELCMQTEEELRRYGKYLEGLKTLAVYGGAPIGQQLKRLKGHPKVVVATPGRLIDLIKRKAIELSGVQTVVLDEADEMLNMGFRDDIDFILGNSPDRTGTWLFSATMNKEVRRISKRYMKTPVEVSVAKENSGNRQIKHQYFKVNHFQRFEALCSLLDFLPEIYGIIFTRTRRDAKDVAENLSFRGIKVAALHGDMDQKARSRVMDKFKNRQLQLIAATDVAARGIDVQDMSYVINYELPEDSEIYVHRSGRTGRAGKSGVCLSLVTGREFNRIKQIERLSRVKFQLKELPDRKAIIEQKMKQYLNQLHTADVPTNFKQDILKIINQEDTTLSTEDLLPKILWLQFGDKVKLHEQTKKTNAKQSNSGKSSTLRIFMNLGKKEGMDEKKLLRFIANYIDIDNNFVTHITVNELCSFYNIPKGKSNKFKKAFKGVKHKGRKVRVEDADAPKPAAFPKKGKKSKKTSHSNTGKKRRKSSKP